MTTTPSHLSIVRSEYGKSQPSHYSADGGATVLCGKQAKHGYAPVFNQAATPSCPKCTHAR